MDGVTDGAGELGHGAGVFAVYYRPGAHLRHYFLGRCALAAGQCALGFAVIGLNIPIGQWHTVRTLESGTVIMEVKDGPYEPTGEEDVLTV